jgi:undecaprenyl-diphosphatase
VTEPVSIGSAIALGALQGATEFLPVSSSGHIALGAMLFDIPNLPLSMVVLLHAGTLIATGGLFYKEIGILLRDLFGGISKPSELLESDSGRTIAGILLASVPTAIIGLLFEERLEALAQIPWVLGACLLVTAVAVVSTRWSGSGTRETLSYGAYFLIGLAQGLAVLPGISRSGSTIALAMLLGMSGASAFRFSFLLSLPAVLGAVVLKLAEPGALSSLGLAGVIGAVVALVTGYAALVLLRRLVTLGRFWAFAIYLIPMGIGLIVWDLM